MGGVSATLGNGYEIQGQNYVARLQGRVLRVWSRYRNFILGISSFRWIIPDMIKWSNGQQDNLLFQRSEIVSGEDRFSNFWYREPSVMLIASAKSQSARAASQRPAFMSGCLTISHMCLPCLLSERRLLFWRCLFVVERERCAGKGGRVVHWEGGKGVWLKWSDKVGKVCEWSECKVTSWECWQNNEVVRSKRWKRNEVAIWERWDGSDQGRWDGI